MSDKKYYAVATGKVKNPTIFNTWAECKKVTQGCHSKFKSFDNFEDAKKFIEDNCGNAKIEIVTGSKKKLSKKANSPKICPICEKPHYMRMSCCTDCNRKIKEYGTSIVKMMNIKKENPGFNVWDIAKAKPYIVTKPLYDKKKEAHAYKTAIKEIQRSDDYKKYKFNKYEDEIPDYIKKAMNKYPSRQLIGLTGTREHTLIHYTCLKCREDQVISFNDMNRGHDCAATKSSGQIIVEQFLKGKFKYVIESETFLCVSPVTKRQLPYDIELIDRKILIEIQGDQHLKFTPHFHGTEENFEYQQKKDSYKKRWAESKGYKLLYIYYSDFKNNKYIDKILEAIN